MIGGVVFFSLERGEPKTHSRLDGTLSVGEMASF
jgi:hypothetical protein